MSWDYFDRVYCIHLPNEERRHRISKIFAGLGMDVEFVHAQPPGKSFTMPNMRRNPAAEFGCSLSHIKAVARAIQDRAMRPLFFEDDVEFIRPERIEQVIDELPEWDVLYFGGHPRGPAQRVSETLARVSTFSFAEAYALRNPGGFLEFWLDRIGQPNAMYDMILGEYAAANRGYCVYPLMTRQPTGFSFIGGKIDDKSGCLEKGWHNNLA